jgi:hypothetical protein
MKVERGESYSKLGKSIDIKQNLQAWSKRSSTATRVRQTLINKPISIHQKSVFNSNHDSKHDDDRDDQFKIFDKPADDHHVRHTPFYKASGRHDHAARHDRRAVVIGVSMSLSRFRDLYVYLTVGIASLLFAMTVN